jgi:hypothetical protein
MNFIKLEKATSTYARAILTPYVKCLKMIIITNENKKFCCCCWRDAHLEVICINNAKFS